MSPWVDRLHSDTWLLFQTTRVGTCASGGGVRGQSFTACGAVASVLVVAQRKMTFMSSGYGECFFVAPIGKEGSEDRRYSDQVLRHIVRASLEPIGFKVQRADEISEPGMITVQVIRRVCDCELVVADLTNTNANVMYELAVRHVIKKPVILIASGGQLLPFDINTERTIYFNIQDADSIESAKTELVTQVRSIKTKSFRMETPITIAETGFFLDSKHPIHQSIDQVRFPGTCSRRLPLRGIEPDLASDERNRRWPSTVRLYLSLGLGHRQEARPSPASRTWCDK